MYLYTLSFFRSIQALLVFVSIQEQGGKICINSLTNWLFNYIILGVNGVSSSLLSLYKKANSSLKVIKCDCLYPGWLVWTEAGVGFFFVKMRVNISTLSEWFITWILIIIIHITVEFQRSSVRICVIIICYYYSFKQIVELLESYVNVLNGKKRIKILICHCFYWL